MSHLNAFSSVEHATVLLHETVDGLALKENGIYIDGTFGRGGHSRLILSKLSANGRLIAIDRDPKAVAEAQKIQDSRFHIEHSALDMRMDDSKGMSAAEWLQYVSEQDLAWVLKTFGEERFAKKIASAIVNYNKSAVQNGGECLTRTLQLAELIAQTVPFKDKHKHPATRSFQAIRIFINSELDELEKVLQSALTVLAPGGRLSIISFHSLEDRMVKHFMRKQSQGEDIPKGLPLREDQIQRNQTLKVIGKAIMPSDEEIAQNPRARSAVLRIAERLS